MSGLIIENNFKLIIMLVYLISYQEDKVSHKL